jgi:group I intron endonuclease
VNYSSIDWKTKAQEIGVHGFIYIIINTSNDKKYIGLTTDSLYNRYCGHVSNSISQREVMLLARAIHKYGRENFKITCIGTAQSKEEIENFEKEAILFYSSHVSQGGYNVSWGGYSSGKHSDETKEKISNTKRSQKRKITDEHKSAISKASKGKRHTPEVLAMIVSKNTGLKRTPEFCISHRARRQKQAGKPIIAISSTGERLYFKAVHEASRQLNLPNRSLIAKVANGTYKQYKGWRFEYASMV